MNSPAASVGALVGVRVVEIAAIGPVPFTAMMLADMSADVVRLDRADRVRESVAPGTSRSLWDRSRRSVGVDLKHPKGIEAALRLIGSADVLLEGFRPGVAERLGIGPQVCRERNPGLVYGRMTGWGQEGPFASAAGHDINYIALTGALDAIGRRGQSPVPPLNLIGDFGGGGMLLALGICAALVERSRSGFGQVVDAAMVDGSALLTTMIHAFRSSGEWRDERGTNLIDSGAPFYDVYETADGKYISLGSIEPQFYGAMLDRVGLADDPDFADQLNQDKWPELKGRLAAVFRSRTRDEWVSVMEGADACFAPVLSFDEAPKHEHNVHRGTFTEVNGLVQPAPAPRFDRTPSSIRRPPSWPGEHSDEILSEWGFTAAQIEELRSCGAVR